MAGKASTIGGVGKASLPPADSYTIDSDKESIVPSDRTRSGAARQSYSTTVSFNPSSLDDYRRFLAVKSLPRFRFSGRTAEVPNEYVSRLGIYQDAPVQPVPYEPVPCLFDYQRDIARVAIRKQKFAVFAEPGLGKTLILLEFARYCAEVLPPGKAILIVCPLMVVRQTIAEVARFYGDSLTVEQVLARDLPVWLSEGNTRRIGITNFEALTDRVRAGRLGALIVDESSILKSHYGAFGRRLIGLGAGLNWKLCLTGTPAPNDRIEYATHAVFLDQFPTTNAFLAKYFVNRGQTDNRWELKPHALRPFYRSLSDWCIFLRDPATYDWKDNPQESIPPIQVHFHDVDLTEEQASLVSQAGGDLFGTPGGITSRAKLSQLAKGRHNGKKVAANKPAFIRDLIASWPDESTLVWCRFNQEQEELARILPGAASITGTTKEMERERIIAGFQDGTIRTILSKPRILGFGLNLQIATRQVFSTLIDSYEEYHQAVKRSNRVGSTRPLNVHLPLTSVERPMVDTVIRKARRVDEDTAEQEQLFKEVGYVF